MTLPAGLKPRSRRFHIRVSGVIYIIITALLVIAAVNSQSNLLFIAFGLGIGGLLIGGVLSGAGMMSLQIARRSIPIGTAGEPTEIRYSIRNASAVVPLFALDLRERSVEKGDVATAWVVAIPPRSSRTTAGVLAPLPRGVWPLGELEASTTFPFGIARKAVTFTGPARCLIAPARVEVPAGVLNRVAGRARVTRRSRPTTTGDGDFFALREYAPGDPRTRIAWKRTATLGVPVVPIRRASTDRQVWLVAETASVDKPTADRVLGAVRDAYVRLVDQGFEVGVVAGGREVSPAKGTGHRARVDRLLATADAKTRSVRPAHADDEACFVIAGPGSGVRADYIVPSTDDASSHRAPSDGRPR